MIKIKISIPNSAPPIIRQTHLSNGKWDDCIFYINTSVKECDYWFVLDEIETADKTICSPQNIVLITGEPPFVKLYSHKYTNQFSKILTCQKNLLKKKKSECSIPALPWMVGAKMQAEVSLWDRNNYLDYDFFKQELSVTKKDKVAVITSNKSFTKGHRNRLAFILGLKEEMPHYIDIFGSGFNKIADKYDILSNYKYALVIENCEYPNYWTEKLADAYLSQTFPFYSGCPNIDSFFDRKAFERLNLNDIASAKNKIKMAIETDLYSERSEKIIQAKKLILDKYNLFAMIADFVKKDQLFCREKEVCECSINPLGRTIDTRIRTRILKHLGLEF